MNVLDSIRDQLSQTINPDQMFVYEGKYLQAIAFLQGKKTQNIDKIKELARQNGFEYNYQYECYMKKPDSKEQLNGAYREEKDNFIDRIIKWKLGKN